LFGGGGAHGTSIPLLLSSAPLGVFALVGKLVGEPYMGYGDNATVLGAPLVWAGLGWLVALSGRGRLRLARILALLHYASGLALIATAGEEPGRLERLVQISPALVMWATIYLAGQAALWSSMRAGPEARQAIVGAMVGLFYGSVLAFLSLGAIGGGHGSIVPLLLSSAPLGVLLLVGNLVGASHVGEAILFAMLYGYTADMDGARVGGCAVRRWDEPQTHSGSGSVAVRVGPRARRDDSRLAHRFSCRSVESAAVGRYMGDGLQGRWRGGGEQAGAIDFDRPSNHRVWTQFSLPAPQRPAESNRAA
jgi:hypothetical protein